MAEISSTVSGGDAGLATQYNNLRIDALNRRWMVSMTFGKEGAGVLAAAERIFFTIPNDITDFTLDRIRMKPLVSGSATFKILLENWNTTALPTTEVSDSASRPLFSSAFGAEKTTFGGTWDVTWTAGQMGLVEVVSASTVEQVAFIMEGDVGI